MGRKEKQIRVKDTWLLRFVRNADCSENENEKIQASCDSISQWYVFDYYDRMVCKRGELNYDECMGLSGDLRDFYSGSSVASNYHTLISLESDKDNMDPFFDIDGDSIPLPYLSLVTVNMIADYQEGNDDNIFEPSENDIATFLEECMGLIYSKANDACEAFLRMKGKENVSDHFCIRVLESMNSGSYCVVIRTDCIELGYYVAMSIRTFNMKPSVFCFSECWFSTFTMTCMQYQIDNNNIAVIPQGMREVRAENGDNDVVLRLSVDQNLIKKIAPLSSVVDNSRGLYGRYDVTVNLNLHQFLEIYPWICACKFGTEYPQVSDRSKLKDDTVRTLIEVLSERSMVHCVNERVLVGSGILAEIPDRGNDNYRVKRTEQVRKEKNEVDERIKRLKEKGRAVPYYEREFLHYIDLIDDIWRDFEHLRLQDDSYVNGNVFYTQMWVLLDVIEAYLDSFEDCKEKVGDGIHNGSDKITRIGYQDLLVHLRRAVTCINNFQKLIQSVNQQSFQAPNYDIQMHCDLEKIVIAHMEFARSFLTKRFAEIKSRGIAGDFHQAILPVFTVASYQDSICAMPLFLLPYGIKNHNGHVLCNANHKAERLLLSIMAPTIDMLGNLYRTIPLICHEVAHNFRIIRRKERNDALCKYMMNKVSHYIVQLWLSKNCENSIYVSFGEIEGDLKDLLTESLMDGYHRFVGDVHVDSNIGSLISNVLSYLGENIFISQDKYNRSTPIVTPDVLRKCICDLALIYQGVAAIDEAEWYGEYNECLRILEESANENVSTISSEKMSKILCTVRNMAGNAISKYTHWYGRLLEDFKNYIEDHYELGERKGIEQFEILRKWMKWYSNNMRSRFPSNQSKIDKLIMTMAKEVKPFHESMDCFNLINIKESYEKEKESIRVSFSAQKHGLRYAFDELLQKLKDISLLYSGAQSGITAYPLQDRLLEDYRDRVRDYLMDIKNTDSKNTDSKNSDSFKWNLLGAETIQAYLNPLGIDYDTDKLFRETMCSVIMGISEGTIEALVRDSTVVYREIFADLGMCAPLGLSVFGYLLVLSNAKTFRGNGLNDDMQYDSFGIERALTVCRVLSKNIPDDFDEQCSKYFASMSEEINNYLTETGKASEELKDYVARVKELISARNKRDDALPDLRCFAKYIREDRVGGYEKLMECMKSMWFFAMYIWHYKTKTEDSVTAGVEHINIDLVKHFQELYDKHMKENKFDLTWDSHVLKTIGESYNSGSVNLASSEEEKFKDSLSFVLYYYYRTWSVFSRSCDVEKMRDYTNRLMGGE